jgi:hypothetical protein
MATTTPIAGNYTDNAAVAQQLKHAAIDSLHSFRPGTGPLTVAPVSDELEVTGPMNVASDNALPRMRNHLQCHKSRSRRWRQHQQG